MLRLSAIDRRGSLPPTAVSRRLVLLAALALLLLGAAPAPRAQTLADGVLLVAQESLQDPAFEKSVVLILRHDEDGTLGLVINRITSLKPAEIFDELAAPLGQSNRGGRPRNP